MKKTTRTTRRHAGRKPKSKALKFKATPGLDIAALKAGDQVQARVTDSLAIVVEKPLKQQP